MLERMDKSMDFKSKLQYRVTVMTYPFHMTFELLNLEPCIACTYMHAHSTEVTNTCDCTSSPPLCDDVIIFQGPPFVISQICDVIQSQGGTAPNVSFLSPDSLAKGAFFGKNSLA